MTTRRDFLKSSAIIGAAGAMGIRGSAQTPTPTPLQRPVKGMEAPSVGKAASPLSILILGGTGFTGPQQVNYALARGHKVTLLNRNRTRPDLFKGQVDQLIGDLSGDVSALAGKSFDAVLDIPTTYPFWVRNVGQHLKGRVKQYVFISTISVYASNANAGEDETGKTLPLPAGLDPYALNPVGNNYGPLKAFSEQEVEKTYPGAALIIRPGLIVGPLDRSDRFTYWPVRIDRGGEVLAPGDPNDPVQIIDARDLAEWTIRMIEKRATGVFNATGPDKTLSMSEMLYGIKGVTTAGAQFTWVPADFLRAQKVQQWRDMPVWIAPGPQSNGFSRRNVSKAVAAGLTYRPLAETARDTLEWHKTRPESEREALAVGKIAGMAAAREAEVLAAWKAGKASMKDESQ